MNLSMKYLYVIPKSFLAIILLPLTMFAACSNKKPEPGTNKAQKATYTSKADTNKQKLMDAPDFTLKKEDGSSFTLSKHKGQVVILNIWATWCPPCREEIPDFVKIQKKMKDEGILFVGVSVDKKGWSAVRPFAKKYGINYPIMVDDGTVRSKYGPFRGIPTTFIINKEGKVAYAAVGMINTNALQPVLEKLAKR
jgi:cytochrome c biogenesis protein CcmG/thiol:disulfide interchange protein DsbE